MKDERVAEVLAYIAAVLRENFGVAPSRMTDYESSRRNFVRGRAGFSHVLWMCEEAQDYVAAGRIKKACRWLGFVQCFLWCNHVFSVRELRNMSRDRPDGVPVYQVNDVLQFDRSPGVRVRILAVRPTGYSCEAVEDGPSAHTWQTDSEEDPYFLAGWSLASPHQADLWPVEATPAEVKPAEDSAGGKISPEALEP